MQDLPSFRSYGNYSSKNYGAHCLVFNSPKIDVYFSYDTPVAFNTGSGLVVCKNYWGTTTGKHLNWIDEGDKKNRIGRKEFERLLAAAVK